MFSVSANGVGNEQIGAFIMSAIVDYERIRRTVVGMESLTDEQIAGILNVAQEAEAEEKSARKQALENLAPVFATVVGAFATDENGAPTGPFARVSKSGNPGWSVSATLADGTWVSLNVNAPKKK